MNFPFKCGIVLSTKYCLCAHTALKNKFITLLMLALILASQSFAGSRTHCDMGEASESDHSTMMKHESGPRDHQMSDMQMDCCDQNCECPVGTCSALGATSNLISPAIFRSSLKILFALNEANSPFINSLIKPPILC